jgi:hypothetical protein
VDAAPRPRLAAPSWELQPDRDGTERLDWSAFLTRFFPNSRRHDFEALAAYEAYRNKLEHGPSNQRSATQQSPLLAAVAIPDP